MDNADSLKKAINQYEAQLTQVLISLKADNADVDGLNTLRTDLEQLIEISKAYLAELIGQNSDETHPATNDFDEEYSSFMNEIAELSNEGNEDCENVNDQQVTDNGEYLKDHLDSLIGMKCMVSHIHKSGREESNLAMVSEVISASADVQSMADIQVKVMFTHPTIINMLPCPFYLNGECKYDEDKCRYSHGEIVPLTRLKDYDEPDYSIIKLGDAVLVKSDQLWNKCTVTAIDSDSLSVKIDEKNEICVKLEDVVPIGQLTSNGEDSNSDLSESEDFSTEFFSEASSSSVVQCHSTGVGNWEQHTKGIGSKLMRSMGYTMGSGLGKLGEGRVEPVPVQVLPTRMSLDYCMRLREDSGGDQNLFSMERRLYKLNKFIRKKNKRKSDNETNNREPKVFNFINRIFSADETNTKDKEYTSQSLKASSTKNLNLSSFRIAENIKKTEKDISKYTESLKRQKNNSFAYKEIQSKLEMKNNELKKLKTKENVVSVEQQSRKDKTKLNIF